MFLKSFHCSARLFQVKPNVALISKLRKETEISISKAKEALINSENDYEKAMAWLAKNVSEYGSKKALKLQERNANEGLASSCADGVAAAIVQVNCETDFVARNEKFRDFVGIVRDTSLSLIKNQKLPAFQNIQQELENDPAINKKMLELIALFGEKIVISKAIGIHNPDLHCSCYVHQTGNKAMGRIASIVALNIKESNGNIADFSKQLARHIVGMNPKAVDGKESDENLVTQSFLADPSITVAQAMHRLNHKAVIVGFQRYEIGE